MAKQIVHHLAEGAGISDCGRPQEELRGSPDWGLVTCKQCLGSQATSFLKNAKEGAEQFRVLVPGDSKEEQGVRESLSSSILTLVFAFGYVPELLAPNGCTWKIAGRDGDYTVSIQRPNAPDGFPGLYMKLKGQLERVSRIAGKLERDGRIDETTARLLMEAARG